MNAVSAAAMWEKSNISTCAQRIILRHLTNEFGSRLVVPEYEISALGENFVKLDCNSFLLHKRIIHYWTKSLIDILETSLKHRFQLSSIDMNGLSGVDLVIGGDHGQRKFRCMMKVILRDKDGKNVDSFCIKIGHIDCEKDKYKVLKIP